MANDTQSWTITLEQDGEDLILPFPDDLLSTTGWKEGDTIQWIDLGNGAWQLKKKDD
jgi:hypothetical protein